jgi:hypothetical protein
LPVSRKDLYNDAKPKNGCDMMTVEQNLPGNEGRIRGLETRLMHLEAIIKGLTEELSDIKDSITKITTAPEEQSAPGANPGPVAEVTAFQPQFAAAPQPVQASAPKREQFDLIMQSDGTLKPERRAGSDFVIVK